MPRQFVNINESEFELDGIRFDKVFIAFPVASDSLKVVCAYESRNEILPVTRFDEIQVDGATPTDQANAISLLKGVVFNSILSGGSSGYKGTKVHWLSLSGIDTSLDELKYIAEAVKSKGAFTCDEGEQMVFQTSIPLGEGSGVYGVLQRWYRLLPSLTTIGGTTDPVPAAYFMPDGRVEVLDSSLFIDLGTITSPDTVESVFNQGNSGAAWNVQDEQFVTAVLDGVSIIWRFNGGFGLWGGDDIGTDPEVLEAAAANFDNLSEQPESSDVDKSSVTPDTVSTVDLSNVHGNYCNQESANPSTSYVTINHVSGGKARILVNAASEPTVTGGTKIKGSDFVASTNIYLWIEYNGTDVEFWFEEI